MHTSRTSSSRCSVKHAACPTTPIPRSLNTNCLLIHWPTPKLSWKALFFVCVLCSGCCAHRPRSSLRYLNPVFASATVQLAQAKTTHLISAVLTQNTCSWIQPRLLERASTRRSHSTSRQALRTKLTSTCSSRSGSPTRRFLPNVLSSRFETEGRPTFSSTSRRTRCRCGRNQIQESALVV